MKPLYHSKYIMLTVLFWCCLSSCQKETDWLDTKPNKALVVPSHLEDFQNLLNNEDVFNTNDNSLGFMAVEDYLVTYPVWQARPTATERNTYVWALDPYEGESAPDWTSNYKAIFYCNTILEGLDKMPSSIKSSADWQQVKGQALFFRAYAFFKLAVTFCKPYDGATADKDLGLPLKLSADPNDQHQRASLADTYQQLLQDLQAAELLLPDNSPVRTRPSKIAARSLLARIFLTMEAYDKAFTYADLVLQQNSTLLDFNTLSQAATYPITLFNAEDLFHTRLTGYGIFNNSRCTVDTTLFQSYQVNDLRRLLYFSNKSGTIAFKGSYEGGNAYYGGIATDELYLIRSECQARKNNTQAALADLNALLQKRWKTGTFLPFTASTPDVALSLILTERRKELVFRGLRWQDLRRLNKDNRFAVSVARTLNGTNYSLAPNSSLYVFPIPDDEIRLSGIQQNPR